MKLIAIGLGLLLSGTTAGYCCSFGTDSNPGSRCLKSSGSIYGVCISGIAPGNSNDRQPVRAPLDVNGTYGNTCSFNTDCGAGGFCAKGGGIYGACLKR
jgi:hypothetical protein